jgi:hypothetical protein
MTVILTPFRFIPMKQSNLILIALGFESNGVIVTSH